MLLNIALVKFSELILFFDNIFYTLLFWERPFFFIKKIFLKTQKHYLEASLLLLARIVFL